MSSLVASTYSQQSRAYARPHDLAALVAARATQRSGGACAFAWNCRRKARAAEGKP